MSSSGSGKQTVFRRVLRRRECPHSARIECTAPAVPGIAGITFRAEVRSWGDEADVFPSACWTITIRGAVRSSACGGHQAGGAGSGCGSRSRRILPCNAWVAAIPLVPGRCAC